VEKLPIPVEGSANRPCYGNCASRVARSTGLFVCLGGRRVHGGAYSQIGRAVQLPVYAGTATGRIGALFRVKPGGPIGCDSRVGLLSPIG
jgi:hypothetical protein